MNDVILICSYKSKVDRKYLQVKERDPAFESYDKQTLDNKLRSVQIAKQTFSDSLDSASLVRSASKMHPKYLFSPCLVVLKELFLQSSASTAFSLEQSKIVTVACAMLHNALFWQTR
jgi:hypothetical protein